MNKTKAIALNGITFYHTQGHAVVTEGCFITFDTYEHMELYIQDRRIYWRDLLNLELTISPDNNETLLEKDVLKVLRLVCEKLGVDFDSAISKYQGCQEVEVRRFTIGICNNRKVQKTTIAKVLNLDHSTISHHTKTLMNLSKVDASYRKLFLDTEDYVMQKIGDRYMDDGSGKRKT